MFTLFVSIAAPLAVYFGLPWLITKITGKKPVEKTYIILACVCYIASWHIPSPLIEGRDTSFMTHVVGGGMFSAFLWLYIRAQLREKHSLFYDLVAMYILVSALGVANELFEFVTTKIGLAHLSSSDTWWDLFANTLGAVVVWLLFSAYSLFISRRAGSPEHNHR